MGRRYAHGTPPSLLRIAEEGSITGSLGFLTRRPANPGINFTFAELCGDASSAPASASEACCKYSPISSRDGGAETIIPRPPFVAAHEPPCCARVARSARQRPTLRRRKRDVTEGVTSRDVKFRFSTNFRCFHQNTSISALIFLLHCGPLGPSLARSLLGALFWSLCCESPGPLQSCLL